MFSLIVNFYIGGGGTQAFQCGIPIGISMGDGVA